jgi:hypothetical protein
MFRRFGGIDQHSGDLAIDQSSASELVNMDLHPVGEAATRAGMTALGTSPDAAAGTAVLGMAWNQAAGGRYMYALKGSKLWRAAESAPNTWATAATWGTAATAACFAKASFGSDTTYPSADAHPDKRGLSLYAATGATVPWVDWGSGGQHLPAAVYSATAAARRAGYPNGATTHASEWRNWSTDPPRGMCMVGRGTVEQMFAWGFAADRNRVDYSALQIPWHFGQKIMSGVDSDSAASVDGGYFYAISDDADWVVGVVQHMNRIVVFKRTSTLVYSGFPGVDMHLENIYPVGCTSYRSVVRAGGDLLWWSDQGPVSLFGVQEFGDLGYSNIGTAVKAVVNALISSEAEAIHALHDRAHFRIIWFIKRDTDGTSQAVVYYYDSPRRWSLYDGKFCRLTCSVAADGITSSGLVMYGAYADGTIGYLGQGTTDLGSGYASSYSTAWLGVEDAGTRKRVTGVDVMFGTGGGISMTTSIAWDYSALYNDAGDVVRVIGAEAGGGWDFGTWSDTAIYNAWAADPASAPDGIAFWNSTTKMIARIEAVGTGFIFRVKYSAEPTFRLHLAGWRPVIDAKGTQ